MRLGLIIYDSLNTLTGGYIYDKILVRYLRRAGHQVDIISLSQRNYGRHLMDNCSRKTWSDLAAIKYDLLLQDELSHPSLFWANHRLQKKANYPIVAIVHQVLCRQPRSRLLNRIYQAVEKRYLQSVDAYIFNSATTRKTVEGIVDFIRPSFVASPAGDRLGQLSSIDLIEARALESGPLRLIFVGNVLPNKGLIPLLRGLSGLSSKKWFFTVVGSLTMDGGYVRQVKKLIADKKISRQVQLMGPKNGTELTNLLSQSHVFIMPYSHEGFGIAYLEAMAFALPVLGSTTGAVKEFIKSGLNGFLIEPDDFDMVNQCILNLYHDRKRLIQMSHAALQTFNARPKWKDTMESVQRYLRDIAQSEWELTG